MKKLLGMMIAITVVAILSGAFTTAAYAAAKEIEKDGRFIAYDDGTVFDTQTKLMWAAKDNGDDVIWADAKTYCENYRGGGYTDWRMPTKNELSQLYDKSKTYKADKGGKVHITKLIHLTYVWSWSSSEGSYFSFFSGYLERISKNYTGHSVLPVRSGK